MRLHDLLLLLVSLEPEHFLNAVRLSRLVKEGFERRAVRVHRVDRLFHAELRPSWRLFLLLFIRYLAHQISRVLRHLLPQRLLPSVAHVVREPSR